MNKIGKAPVPGTSIAPVPIAMSAPPAVMIVPPIPDADPAKCGRTDIIPDCALGSTIPFPTPIKQTHPKNETGIGVVKRKSEMQSSRPVAVIIAPVRTIRLTPNAVESRPERPLPIM